MRHPRRFLGRDLPLRRSCAARASSLAQASRSLPLRLIRRRNQASPGVPDRIRRSPSVISGDTRDSANVINREPTPTCSSIIGNGTVHPANYCAPAREAVAFLLAPNPNAEPTHLVFPAASKCRLPTMDDLIAGYDPWAWGCDPEPPPPSLACFVHSSPASG